MKIIGNFKVVEMELTSPETIFGVPSIAKHAMVKLLDFDTGLTIEISGDIREKDIDSLISAAQLNIAATSFEFKN